MDFYKWCHVLCQLWLLPSWITSATLPEVAREKGLNSTSQPATLDSSPFFNGTIQNYNVTARYETVSSTSTDSSSKVTVFPSTETKLSTKGYPVSEKNSSLWDLTTKTLSSRTENITAFIDKMSENKTFGDDTNTVSPENSSVVSVANTNMPINTARVTDGHKSVSTTSKLESFRETTSMINSTVGLDSNKASVNITVPLDIDDISKTTPYIDSENDTSEYNSSSITPSTTFRMKSTATATPSSGKGKPIVWTTPHPNVVRNMWLAKRARSRTHTSSLHHLSLVPIEDGPFGSLIWRDKKYLITVLVPIGIGIIGAVCIISMAYVVRFCHRHERKMQEIRETIQKRYATQNDQVILLTNSSDDEF